MGLSPRLFCPLSLRQKLKNAAHNYSVLTAILFGTSSTILVVYGTELRVMPFLYKQTQILHIFLKASSALSYDFMNNYDTNQYQKARFSIFFIFASHSYFGHLSAGIRPTRLNQVYEEHCFPTHTLACLLTLQLGCQFMGNVV